MKHTGIVKEGKLKLHNRPLLEEALSNYEGRLVELKITGKRNTRSNRQNAWYWVCVVPGFFKGLNTLGSFGRLNNHEEAHEVIKSKFLGFKERIMPDGEIVRTTKSTKSLDKIGFSDFAEEVIQFAAEWLNTVIPYPNEDTMEELGFS